MEKRNNCISFLQFREVAKTNDSAEEKALRAAGQMAGVTQAPIMRTLIPTLAASDGNAHLNTLFKTSTASMSGKQNGKTHKPT